MTADGLLERIAGGRTDLVWEQVARGGAVTARTADGVRLLQWCAYYGDVSAIRQLRLLCFGDHRIHPKSEGLEVHLLGKPHV